MSISVFNLFSIGIGPSSSHTVGPMKAAYTFVLELKSKNILSQVAKIQIELFGSLAFTGLGHGTDIAILLGLEGENPETIEPSLLSQRIQSIRANQTIHLCHQTNIRFNENEDFIFNYKELLPFHSNGMRFTAYNDQHTLLFTNIYYSIGGGFIVDENEASQLTSGNNPSTTTNFPYPFSNAKSLIELCEKTELSIPQIMLANESSLRPTDEIKNKLLQIVATMRACIVKGYQTEGVLPGGLKVKRRAPALYQKLMKNGKPSSFENINSMDWLDLFAIAVNEENAAFGRVVTAPTNGAAGIIPAVLEFYLSFYPQAKMEDAIPFLLTAGAIGILYKKGASISGAEVGCQGEIGVASSMAAGAFTAILGGNLYQIENAAEIAMEHHLGMTCDPISGLVQIPCIERNAMGAIKAVNATRLALLGDGQHYVSLDKVIATMKQTGKDMMNIYKETSLGGLAVNLPEC